MMEVKAKVYTSLKNDAALVALLGSTNQIVFYYPNSFTTLPIVCYQELNQSDEDQGYWDNAPHSVESNIQIDVYTVHGTSTTAICKAVDSVMHGLLFNVDFSGDLYEKDEKIQHRVIRYRRSFIAEDLV